MFTINVSDLSDLTINKTIVNEPAEITVGDVLSYKVTVTNTGGATATSLKLVDSLGIGNISNITGTGSDMLTSVLAELSAGETVEVNYEYTVVEANAGSNITNTATLTFNPGDITITETLIDSVTTNGVVVPLQTLEVRVGYVAYPQGSSSVLNNISAQRASYNGFKNRYPCSKMYIFYPTSKASSPAAAVSYFKYPSEWLTNSNIKFIGYSGSFGSTTVNNNWFDKMELDQLKSGSRVLMSYSYDHGGGIKCSNKTGAAHPGSRIPFLQQCSSAGISVQEHTVYCRACARTCNAANTGCAGVTLRASDQCAFHYASGCVGKGVEAGSNPAANSFPCPPA